MARQAGTGNSTGKTQKKPTPEGLANLKPPWKKGQSGNQKGSSKKAKERKAFRDWITEAQLDRVRDKLVWLAERGRLDAIEMVLDRAEGSVQRQMKLDGKVKGNASTVPAINIVAASKEIQEKTAKLIAEFQRES